MPVDNKKKIQNAFNAIFRLSSFDLNELKIFVVRVGDKSLSIKIESSNMNQRIYTL